MKDLKNHLEAEPEKGEPKEEKQRKENQKEKKPKKQRTSFRHGPLDSGILQEDNQVVRALEILLSYDIFKGVNGNGQ